MSKAEHRPPVISVMLAVTDAPTAVAWYERALGATVLWSLGGVATRTDDRKPMTRHPSLSTRKTSRDAWRVMSSEYCVIGFQSSV